MGMFLLGQGSELRHLCQGPGVDGSARGADAGICVCAFTGSTTFISQACQGGHIWDLPTAWGHEAAGTSWRQVGCSDSGGLC